MKKSVKKNTGNASKDRFRALGADISRAVNRYLEGRQHACENCQADEGAVPVALADPMVAFDDEDFIMVMAVLTGIAAEEGVTHDSGQRPPVEWICVRCLKEGIDKARTEYLIRHMLMTKGH